MRRPGLPGFRLDMGESRARRRIWNADQMVAAGTLNLTSTVAGIATQRLIAVRTIEFEFVGAHGLHLHHAQTRRKKYMKNLFILLV
jgi:hypothetical protein